MPSISQSLMETGEVIQVLSDFTSRTLPLSRTIRNPVIKPNFPSMLLHSTARRFFPGFRKSVRSTETGFSQSEPSAALLPFTYNTNPLSAVIRIAASITFPVAGISKTWRNQHECLISLASGYHIHFPNCGCGGRISMGPESFAATVK